MASQRAYLDHNATAPVRPEVATAVAEALAYLGNPSSVHAEGRRARAAIERARDQVAALVGARPGEVTFTSGGTEANNAALRPGALARAGCPASRLAALATDHPSAQFGHGFPPDSVSIVPVEPSGEVDLRTLASILDRHPNEITLVSMALANSETGVMPNVAAVAQTVKARGGLLHVDAVQGAGRVPVDMRRLGADALTLSGHKFGGPPGSGALVVAAGCEGPLPSLHRGGAQEMGRRAGTENGPAIVGFGLAAEIAAGNLASEGVRLRRLRDRAEAEILRTSPDAVVFGQGVERLPNTLAFASPDVPAETALIALDLDGVAVSSGSACSSGKVGRSHVLAAMGVPANLAAGAIRVSFGWSSRDEDVVRFLRAYETCVQRLYERRRARAA